MRLGRRLTQIRGRVKKPLMFGDGEAVGHPGDEVADPSDTLGFGLVVAAIARQPLRRQIARALLIARKQVEKDLFGRVVVVRRWGRIGTAGHTRMDEHPDEGRAVAALLKLEASKRRRGYRETGSGFN